MAKNVPMTVIEIPYSHKSTSVYAMLKAFIKDFIVELQKTYIAQGSRPMDMWKLPALQLKYFWDGPEDSKDYSDKDIAAIVGKTPERVRSVMLEIAVEAMDMLETGKEFENIVASNDMRQVFKTFKNNLNAIELFDLLARRYEVDKEDKKTLHFYLDGLKYKRSDSKYNKPYCIDTKVFDDSAITILKKYADIITKFFKKDPRPLRFETEVFGFMKNEKKWTDEERRLIEAYLRADTGEYEWLGQDDLGNHLVALKWEALDAVDSRLARILFEYGKSHEDDPFMNIDELVNAFNLQAAKYGIDPIPAGQSIPKHPHIQPLGNGRFRYAGVITNSQIDLRAEMKKYVANNNGIVIVDDALAFAQSLNPKYSLSTAKRYLREAGCINDTWNKTHYAVHNDPDTLSRYAQISGKILTGSRPGPRAIKSPKSEALRAKAIDLLYHAPGHKMTKKDLVDNLTPYYTGKYPKTNIPNALKDPIFISEGFGKGSSWSLNMNLYNSEFGGK